MKQPDYIVVGGGSAGCAITHRLVMAGKQVLLLEDGPEDDTLYIHMPATFVRVIGSKRSVVYESEPQPEAGGRKTYVPQGRTLGGGSSLNAMVYIRGQRQDYEDWEAQGCTGWGWDNVLAAFKRSESHMRLSNEYHGTEGPLKVSDTRHRHPLTLAFIKGAQEAGLNYSDDFNGEKQEGVGFYHTTTFNGRRGSTAATYLAAVKGSPKLTIKTGCYVSRVLFDANKKATGVEIVDKKSGELSQIAVKEEVILSAGALSTPKILMLSGIGPKQHLQEHKIKLLHDAPQMGQNYQDHLEVSVYGRSKEPNSLLGNDQGLKALRNGFEWVFFKSGLLTSNVVESGLFADTSGCGRPDIQFHVIPTLMGDVDREPVEGHGISLNPCFLRPKSRGFAKLRSANPLDSMIFESGALKEQADVDTLVRGVKLARKILRTPSMKAVVDHELLPSRKDEVSDAELEKHVRQFAKTVYHPVGTCRMGSDEQAVVDPTLKVNGVTGVRVCDASVMPTLVSGNTNAPTIMIAERCAEFILGLEACANRPSSQRGVA
ncbi:GMC family oxidoreductase [Parathalassolituus penaei]|uniref:GMC family oxidoreductase N-terminal domain-containing protein n=1 Tax=Parathalassolituus penaei TaxID=2997323 RepID=A0A9X3EEZ1_9GAMM|nr:GMC family oxidoreductase N-terminal domain-containing protein [Parathalassolituus penaei]MCY0966299.1 GMC family oxidoreductase N-terminal domain-containing protein [Parathalassolituus penaei]